MQVKIFRQVYLPSLTTDCSFSKRLLEEDMGGLFAGNTSQSVTLVIWGTGDPENMEIETTASSS